MAGDWIKMELCLARKPEVVGMADRLGLDEFAVVGRLHALWSWANEQSIDGDAVNVTETYLDRLTNCPGFAGALRQVGWLEGRDSALAFPNFDRHNGQAAKARALKKDRMKRLRGAQSATEAPQKRHQRREEKRREEEKNIPLNPPVGETPDKPATTKPPAISWTPQDGWANITDADRAEWLAAYPACDLDICLARMTAWLKANPTKARKSNWRRFIGNWLTRQQDRGGTVRSSYASPRNTPTTTETYDDILK